MSAESAIYKSIAKNILFKIDAEKTHHLSIQALEMFQKFPFLLSAFSRYCVVSDKRLETKIGNLRVKNPVGLAAGYDKDGKVIPGIFSMGFGHMEIGTVTPVSQTGNPRPRIFRELDSSAVINYMGFPGSGMDKVAENIGKQNNRIGVLGINVGPNKKSVEVGTFVDDYEITARKMLPRCDFLVGNVSCPNIKGLREIEDKGMFETVMAMVKVRNKIAVEKPIFVKLSPDQNEWELDATLDASLRAGADGFILTNTTRIWPNELRGKYGGKGGLSGKPLREVSTEMIKLARKMLGVKVPIIGVGGVMSGHDLIEKLEAGANAVQVYTGLIYDGPFFVRELNKFLCAYLSSTGKESISEIMSSGDGR